MESTVGNKVIVIGSPGSGKSTLSLRLAKLTHLPLIHLDNVWWKPDRTHVTREAFDLALQGIVEGDKWIIDGSYSRTLEPRFAACDTVVFLDLGVEECLDGITRRVGQTRPDIPWVEHELDPELVALVKAYPTGSRLAVYDMIAKYSDKQVIILRSLEEIEAWLSQIQQH